MSDRTNAICLDGPRVDLHCHSLHSTQPAESVPGMVDRCEGYCSPDDIYRTARRRGMRFVTLTDRNSIAGVAQLGLQPDVIAGSEIVCRFPEDRVRVNVLVWGIGRSQHQELLGLSRNIHKVAGYIADHRIAHAVTNPVGSRGRLSADHVERLLLMFKGFECECGSYDAIEDDLFSPAIDLLDADRLGHLARKHRIPPLWPDPHIKSRIGGSDAYDLDDLARTYTQFPASASTAADILECLRTGACHPMRAGGVVAVG